MSPQKENGEEDDPKKLRERAQDVDSRCELEQNVRVGRELKSDILGEDAGVCEESDLVRRKTLFAMKEGAKLRMARILAQPIETRQQAMNFLGTMIALVDERTPMGSSKIRNSAEHIDRTVELFERTSHLRTRVGEVENTMRGTLKADEQGLIECNAVNMTALQTALNNAMKALKQPGAEDAQINPDEVGDVSFMKPRYAVVDAALRLERLHGEAKGEGTMVDTYNMLDGHLGNLVQRTSIGVQKDGRYSAQQFDALLRDITETSGRTEYARTFNREISPKDRRKWEAIVNDSMFVVSQALCRTEHLYQPNLDGFLQIIDQNALKERGRQLQSGAGALEAEKRARRELQESPVKRAGHGLRVMLSGEKKHPRVPISQLTEQQSVLRKKIMTLVEVINGHEERWNTKS